MKRIRKVRAYYGALSDQSFLVLVQTIHSAMLANSYFELPSPSLEVLKQSMLDFAGKLAIARKRGSPVDTAIKDESRVTLDRIVFNLAFYVNNIAKGDLVILLSSGFSLSSQKNRILLPKIVKGLEMQDGRQKKQMVLRFEPQKNIRLYNYRFTDMKEDTGELLWTGEEFTTTSSKGNVIAPVKSGVIYYTCVRAVNSVGAGDWSDPLSWMAR